MLSSYFQISIFILCAVVSSCFCLCADPIRVPEGRIYFRVQGDIKNPNRGDHALFDKTTFKKLPMTELTHTMPPSVFTATGIKAGPLRYKGVLLETVLDAAQPDSSFVKITGTDDQSLAFSMADIKKLHPLLASEVNEKPLHTMGGDLGEVMLVFPESARINNATVVPLAGIYKITVEPHTEVEQAA